MRRMDREGVPRWELQRRINERAAKSAIDPNGWRIPDTIHEGARFLNLAAGTTRRQIILRGLETQFGRDFDLRRARAYLADARRCPAPRLPS